MWMCSTVNLGEPMTNSVNNELKNKIKEFISIVSINLSDDVDGRLRNLLRIHG